MKKFAYLSIIFLISCSPKIWHKTAISSSNTRINESASSVDSSLVRLILPYRVEQENKMNSKVGENESKLEKGKPESTLTNWLSDIVEESVKLKTADNIDGTLMNYGGIRSNYLAKGDVTLGNVFELMPFDNLVVVLRITGTQLSVFCDHVAVSGGWPVSKSVRFTIKDKKANNITIKGEPLVADKIYRICVPDYIANGGDDCDFLKSISQTTHKYLLRDAILDGIKRTTSKGDKITSALDGRINISN